MIKVVTIVGARPQFIKAAAVSRAIGMKYASKINEVIVHTGQHFDENMSSVFFDQLNIPHPKYNLEVSGGTHGRMTGRMLDLIEGVLLDERPDWVLIYGDTNSTLAGALAAAKLNIPIAHVEAGLRSFNMRMPEEVNRIVADRLSSLLLCPTEMAIKNLKKEGITSGVSLAGDVMFDVSLYYRDIAKERSDVISRLGLNAGDFILSTCHRAENTDEPGRLAEICMALAELSTLRRVVFPVHPRTAKLIATQGLVPLMRDVTLVEPLPFLDMVCLEQCADTIVTDSGGVQKEAFFYGVPCVTVRDETEWTETVELGWNVLVSADRFKIVSAVQEARRPAGDPGRPYGNGEASHAIIAQLLGVA